tara:strand:+ start:2735 stop:3145 length:411 start_codon:yes stop_codon:yes gene_type:complete
MSTVFNDTLKSRVEFYSQPSLVNDPFHPAGFAGTWKFSDHSLIPEVFNGFLQRHFGVMRLKRIPLDDINKLMNEVWEGPGSIPKLLNLENDLRIRGKEIKFTASDIAQLKIKDTEEDQDDDLPLSVFGVETDDDDE